jgi:hypothetical protein
MGFFDKTIVFKPTDTCCGGTCTTERNEDAIREIAYFRWLTATGGSPVSEEESRRFWIEAEQEASNQ